MIGTSVMEELNRAQNLYPIYLYVNYPIPLSEIPKSQIKTTFNSILIRLHVIKKHKRQVSDLLVTSNGKLMVSVSWDYTARLWNISDGKEAGLFKELSTHPFNCIALDPSEKYVALGGWKKHIYVWDILVNKKHAVSRIIVNYDK